MSFPRLLVIRAPPRHSRAGGNPVNHIFVDVLGQSVCDSQPRDSIHVAEGLIRAQHLADPCELLLLRI